MLFPAYLLEGVVIGRPRIEGDKGLAARLFADRPAFTPPITVRPGRWALRVHPENAFVRAEVQALDGLAAPAELELEGEEAVRAGGFDLVEPTQLVFGVESVHVDSVLVVVDLVLVGEADPDAFEGAEQVTLIAGPEPDVAAGTLVRELGRFDDGLDGWEPRGDAFRATATGTAETDEERQLPVTGHAGAFLNSFHPELGNRATGSLTSPPFVVPERGWLALRIGGGEARDYHSQVGVRLLDGEETVQIFTGRRSGELRQVRFDLSPWAGRELRLVAFDEATSAWGHLLLDEVLLFERRE